MRWVAPTEKDIANETLEKRLWAAADQFRANSGLKAGEYSTPLLGLIFLRFAEARFAKRGAALEKVGASPHRGNSRIDDPKACMAGGVLYLTPGARFDYLLQRPEGSNVGKAVNEAMADVEKHNSQLAGPKPNSKSHQGITISAPPARPAYFAMGFIACASTRLRGPVEVRRKAGALAYLRFTETLSTSDFFTLLITDASL